MSQRFVIASLIVLGMLLVACQKSVPAEAPAVEDRAADEPAEVTVAETDEPAAIEPPAAYAEPEEDVQRLLREAWKLRNDMEYDAAMEKVDAALEIAPYHRNAQVMRQSIEDVKMLVEQRRERDRGVEQLPLAPIPPDPPANDI